MQDVPFAEQKIKSGSQVNEKIKWDRYAAIYLLELYDCQRGIKLIQLHVGSFQFKDH